MAEAEDLKSSQCGFDPHSGHQIECSQISLRAGNMALNDSVKKKTKYTPELGKRKQELYRQAHKRIENSIAKGSHIEAVALIESIMSDRIESALGAIAKKEVNASTLGSLFKQLNQLHPADPELVESIKAWNKSRGLVIHQMVKLTNNYDSDWSARISFAREVAKEGLIVLKNLRKFTDRIIHENR